MIEKAHHATFLINVNYFSGPATIKTPVSWVLPPS